MADSIALCFRGKMASVSIRREWTISRRDAYRFRIRTRLLARLKSEARSRRRFYDNWAARRALHSTFSRRDGGRNYFRVVPPTGVALAISGGWAAPPPAPLDVFISSPSLFTYTSFTRFRLPPMPSARHRRNVICEKPGGPAIVIFSDVPRIQARQSRSLGCQRRAKSRTYCSRSIGYG